LFWLTNLLGGYKWLAFNGFAFGMGAVVTSLLALSFAPAVALLIMAVMTVYDLVAVDFSEIMGDLVEMSTNVGLPNYIVIPTTVDFELATVREYVNGELESKPDSIAFLIGVGDFVFPAFLVGSLYVQNGLSWPVYGGLVGTVGAMVSLRHRVEDVDGGLAALPYLNTGAVCGLFLAVVVSPLSVSVVLGL
jgi:presenilin-like A22 family membrane protease